MSAKSHNSQVGCALYPSLVYLDFPRHRNNARRGYIFLIAHRYATANFVARCIVGIWLAKKNNIRETCLNRVRYILNTPVIHYIRGETCNYDIQLLDDIP